MPSVVALILTDQKQLQVCLNEFSHRADEFRQSPLCKKFVELDGVTDPVALEANGQIITCRGAVSRKNEADVITALQAQTGILYSTIRLNRHTVSAATYPQGIG
jgi:hypothetical protein